MSLKFQHLHTPCTHLTAPVSLLTIKQHVGTTRSERQHLAPWVASWEDEKRLGGAEPGSPGTHAHAASHCGTNHRTTLVASPFGNAEHQISWLFVFSCRICGFLLWNQGQVLALEGSTPQEAARTGLLCSAHGSSAGNCTVKNTVLTPQVSHHASLSVKKTFFGSKCRLAKQRKLKILSAG